MSTKKKNSLIRIISDDPLASLNFPLFCLNFVGKDIIPEPKTILDLFCNFFKPLKTVWLEDKISDGNNNWFIAIMERM